ncbi:MAG: hypothetical protein NC300_11355 [Bacteroidales bacterium]|nr:hypothetical protein [Clostridium sp.]MCM1204728.1 hypothetical protein [Bacteroidales bacterium]
MAKRSRRTKAADFPPETKELIRQRDGYQCLFCRLGKYGESQCTWLADIMHYINRSAGGLGIPENGVLGCRYHHDLLDNGNKGYRKEMLEDMKGYLKSLYPGWNEADLYYRKE